MDTDNEHLPEIDPYVQTSVFHYIVEEAAANAALSNILLGPVLGPVGFDTEERQKRPGEEWVTVATNEVIEADAVDWDAAKICIVQIAVPGQVYIVDVKRMRAFPIQLRRIIESEDIPKVGSGFANDVKFLHEVGVTARNLVEVGMMTKYANPEGYDREDAGGISLERCVLDLFGMKLDKSKRATFDWDGEAALTAEQQVYAGLDAQASLDVYRAAWTFLRAKELELGRLIPDDWYTYNSWAGKPIRTQLTIRNEMLPWAANLCPWYVRGKFQGYHYQ